MIVRVENSRIQLAIAFHSYRVVLHDTTKHMIDMVWGVEGYYASLRLEEGGRVSTLVGGEPPPPPVVDYLTISCRRRLGRTSNHFV